MGEEPSDDAQQRAGLVSMVSHELRGPISTIKGLAVTTRTYYDQLPDDEKREFLGLIEQEADRMLEIVSQTSLAMKLSAGVLPLQRGPADLAAIVREGIGAAGLGDDRRVDLDLDEVTIEGDRTHLVEVVRQVVQNAGEYSPPGEPGVGRRTPRTDIGGWRAGRGYDAPHPAAARGKRTWVRATRSRC
jgi:signal transduction histidine kinase